MLKYRLDHKRKFDGVKFGFFFFFYPPLVDIIALEWLGYNLLKRIILRNARE